jgi:S-disulfanyl-L-cysteine oxidoreductase SoxD
MTRLTTVVFLIAIGGLSMARASERPSSSGVFTQEQAKNGERIYRERCAKCHGADLLATDPDAPDLTGEGFKMDWLGKTVGQRFKNIRIKMPDDAPGSLDDQSYLDVVAFILQFNGNPPGKEKLPPDAEALERIVITGADKSR